MSKSFSAYNTTQIDGQYVSPIKLVVLTFSSTTLYMCDRSFGDEPNRCVFDGQIYEPLITYCESMNLGAIKWEQSYETDPGGFVFQVLNNVGVGGYLKFSDLWNSESPAYAGIVVSEIFEGASASGDKIDTFKGQIEDVRESTTDRAVVACSSFETAIKNQWDYEICNSTNFPNADPDDIGKMMPEVFGSAKKVPFLAIDTGAISTLSEDLDDSTTTVKLTDASRFGSSGSILVDEEEVAYTGKSGDSLTGCTRGDNSTTAAAHERGAMVGEIKDEHIYGIARPVKALNDVYVADVKQESSEYTAYTGQSGDEHATYGGRAIISFPTWPQIKRKTNLSGEVEDYQVSKRGTEYPAGQVSDETTVDDSGTITFGDAPAGNLSDIEIELSWSFSYTGEFITSTKPRRYEIDGVEVLQVDRDGTQIALRESSFTISKVAWATSITISKSTQVEYGRGEQFLVYATQRCVTDALPVTLSGNSMADGVIGGLVSVDVDGYQDDGAGTYTGTPNALIERPDHIAKFCIIDRCGKSASEVDSTSYTAAGTFYDSSSYVLGFALLQKPNPRTLLNRIAFQSRSLEFWEAGKHHLVHCPDSDSTDHIVSKYRIDSGQIWVKYTGRAWIQNYLSARYNRDWSGYEDEYQANRAVVESEDSTSDTKYGTLAGEQYALSYVTTESHAQDVLDWIKDENADLRIIVEFVGGYWLSKIERGDVIEFSFDSGDFLDEALMGLVTSEDTQFRVIDMVRRNDSAIQIQAIQLFP
jgi:hypothetical protein